MARLQAKLRQILQLVQEVSDDLDQLSLNDNVEVGTALYSVVRVASEALAGIKGSLRVAARNRLGNQPGIEDFKGSNGVTVTVTVPSPTLHIAKAVDINNLRRVLGNRFDQFFETKVVYKPRKGVADRIMKLPGGNVKNTLLLALQEVDSTPRVAFPKK